MASASDAVPQATYIAVMWSRGRQRWLATNAIAIAFVAGREDQPEGASVRLELVLDQVRNAPLGGGVDQEDGSRRPEQRPPGPPVGAQGAPHVLDVAEHGWRSVRAHVWLWGTLIWATVAVFLI